MRLKGLLLIETFIIEKLKINVIWKKMIFIN